jgi:hypothetical protein
MPFTPPTGSGILLCPTGVGFSTISDDIYERLQELVAEGYAELEEVTPQVYEQWASNAKEIKVTREAVSTDGTLNVTTHATFQQGVGAVGGDIEFNTSEHPLPLLYFGESNYGLGLSFRPIIYGEQTGITDEFTYHDIEGFDTEGERPNLSYPRVFIRNDKFYWYKQIRLVFVGTTTNTLSDTENVTTINFPVGSLGDSITITITTRITERFY